MVIKARINSNDDYTFKLCSWDAPSFESSQALIVQSDDFKYLKQAFSEINKIEIFVSDNLTAEYTTFNSFSTMSYLGSVFVKHENIFAEAIQITLTQTNIAEQVKRIQEQINNVIDIESMTTEEYRTYLLDVISQRCQQEIFDGAEIEISTGLKRFTYKSEDQTNIQSAVNILMLVPELEFVPYHASKDSCYLMPSMDMLTIYMTLQLRLTYLTTRCNQLNMWIKGIQTKEELMQITWESELPETFQDNLNYIYNYALYIMQKVSEAITKKKAEIASDNQSINQNEDIVNDEE